MIIPNYLSSFVFAVLPFYIDAPLMRGLLSVFAGTSILHHAKKHEDYPGRLAIAVVDRALCHGIAAMTVLQAKDTPWTPNTSPWLGIYWACLTYIVMVFYVLGLSHGPNGANWHATVHAVSAYGIYCLDHATNRAS